MPIRLYEGSCPCGAVRFAAHIDLQRGTARCPCRRCAKWGRWEVAATAFELTAGEDALIAVRDPGGARMRCDRCGLDTFGVVDGPEEIVRVNVRCLDEVDLAGLPIVATRCGS